MTKAEYDAASLGGDPADAGAETLLRIRDLSVTYRSVDGALRAVDNVSLSIQPGETVGIIGESGSGKSTLGRCMLGLVRSGGPVDVEGAVEFRGQDLLTMSRGHLDALRGRLVSIVFQEALSALNPVVPTGRQLDEAIALHDASASRRSRRRRVLELYEQVGIPHPQRAYAMYPHQMSGGMRQRVLIAMAVANKPAVIVADEPTTALDVTIQAQILDLLKDLQRSTGCSLVVISHNLAVVAQVAQRVVVMYAGRTAELAETGAFFRQPRHPYSLGLLGSVPELGRERLRLAAIPGSPPVGTALPEGCAFHPRCPHAQQLCHQVQPVLEGLPGESAVACHFPVAADEQLFAAGPEPERDPGAGGTGPSGRPAARLEVNGLSKRYAARSAAFGRRVPVVAVDGVDLVLSAARTTALVGESGSGKSTVAGCILGLVRPNGGTISIDGVDLAKVSRREQARLRSRLQVVFQDQFASLDPLWRVGESVAEPLAAAGWDRERARSRVHELMGLVGLSESHAGRYPRELSGGQRARAAIARSLAAEPEVLVLDEPTASLDNSIQAQIVTLLSDLQRKLGTSYLLISHDLGLVRYMADEVLMMYRGKIVEAGPCSTVLTDPQHAYTRQLIAAVPSVRARTGRSEPDVGPGLGSLSGPVS